MGLDATAFTAATLLDLHDQDDDCWENHIQAFIVDPSFHRSLRGLVADRCYAADAEAAHVGNSYGGHSQFRAKLSTVFLGVEPRVIWESPDTYAERPFFELIHFADNEGTIGPDAAADLAADFAEGRTLWWSKVDDDWLRRKYDEWAEVFATAADGGHINGDRADNRSANLAWGTHAENQADQVAHGTHANASKDECPSGHAYTEAKHVRLSRQAAPRLPRMPPRMQTESADQ